MPAFHSTVSNRASAATSSFEGPLPPDGYTPTNSVSLAWHQGAGCCAQKGCLVCEKVRGREGRAVGRKGVLCASPILLVIEVLLWALHEGGG